jgi:hypothetical protein
LVGIVHDRTQLHKSGNQDGGRIFVPVWRCGYMSRRLSRHLSSDEFTSSRLNPGSVAL